VAAQRGSRVFSILLEGNLVLESLQPQSQGSADGETRSFDVELEDMFLDLDFLAETGEPALAALEIERLGG
jgi:hypothetical protein